MPQKPIGDKSKLVQVMPDNKPLSGVMLTQIYVDICRRDELT